MASIEVKVDQFLYQSIPSVTVHPAPGNPGHLTKIFARGQEFDQGRAFDLKIN